VTGDPEEDQVSSIANVTAIAGSTAEIEIGLTTGRVPLMTGETIVSLALTAMYQPAAVRVPSATPVGTMPPESHLLSPEEESPPLGTEIPYR